MIHVDTENDIERLRAYARCAEKENRLLRTRLSMALTRLAEAEGVEQQEILLGNTCASRQWEAQATKFLNGGHG